MWLTRWFVLRPTLVVASPAVVIGAGIAAWLMLPRQQFPNVDFPIVTVSVVYTGASPAQMRDTIVRPLEDQIAGAPGLDHLDATVEDGRAVVKATFSLDSAKSADLLEVQQRVKAAQAQLPLDVPSPVIASFDPSQSPVAQLAVSSSSLSRAALSSLVTQRISREIEQLPGIAGVRVEGAVVPALVVTARPEALASYGLTLTDLTQTISANNLRAPGGYATSATRETGLDVRGDIDGADALRALPILANAAAVSGTSPWSSAARRLRIGDVADVAEGGESDRSESFAGSARAILVDAVKATGASEVSASDAVVADLPVLRREYPALAFTLVTVRSEFTQQQITSVTHTLVEGVAVTALVMLLFLGTLRGALVVLIAIPASLAVALSVMRVLHFTLDTVSLMAMTLVVGILVDDAIVVLENVTRHREGGEAPVEAALRGRAEIGFAALAVTLVDVVIFLPVAFLPGEMGKILSEFALVVATSTLASLLVSFTVTPSLAANWSLRGTRRPHRAIRAFETQVAAVRRVYVERGLPWAMSHPIAVVTGCAVSLAAAVVLLAFGAIGTEFNPAIDRGEFTVRMQVPAGSSSALTRDDLLRLQRTIASRCPDVRISTATAGATTSQTGTVNEAGTGEITVYLQRERRHTTEDDVRRLREELPRSFPTARITVIPATDIAGGSAQPVSFAVSSADGSDPAVVARSVAAVLARTPGAVAVSNSAARIVPRAAIRFDRERARAENVSIGTAAAAIRAAFGGTVATQYLSADGLRDVQVVYPLERREDAREIAAIPLRSADGAIVHAGDVTSLGDASAPAVETRQDRRTIAIISANVAPGYAQSDVEHAFRAGVATLHLPETIRIAPAGGGGSDNLDQTIRGMALAFGTSLALVYLLMLALFDSYRTPAVIFCSLPVAPVGALGALALTHQTLNLFSMIGGIMLVGLVMKNGILLVDAANRYHQDGNSADRAVVRAAAVRFRPIVMTTLAMIAGMLPLALGIDPGGAARRSLGTVVIGGLSSSLLLTLVLVPIVYARLAPRTVRSNVRAVPSPTGSAVSLR